MIMWLSRYITLLVQSSKSQKYLNLEKTWIKMCLVQSKVLFWEKLPAHDNSVPWDAVLYIYKDAEYLQEKETS